MRLGMNVASGTYYDGQIYSDTVKQGSPFGDDIGWPKNPVLPPIGPDGYPLWVDKSKASQPYTLLCVGEPIPAGRYFISADGKGQIQLKTMGHAYANKGVLFNFDGTIKTYIWECKEELPNPTLAIGLMASDPNDPIRNLSVIRPDAEGMFTSTALKELRPYSVLRYLDSLLINSSPLQTWEQYKTLEQLRSNADTLTINGKKRTRGMSIAECCQLANDAGCDPYLLIPHEADDDFIINMAKEVDSQLNCKRVIYIEYSNEIWNNIFSVNAYLKTKYDKLTTKPGNLFTYHGHEQARAINLFKSALPDSRACIRVVCGQAVYYSAAKDTITGASKNGGFDAIACAPYFASSYDNNKLLNTATKYNSADDEIKSIIIGDLIASAYENVETRRPLLKTWRQMADDFKVPFFTYEGGQHFMPNGNAAYTPLYRAINNDLRFENVYRRYLLNCDQGGVDLFIHYKAVNPEGNFGMWGLKTYHGAPETPKSRAMSNYLA